MKEMQRWNKVRKKYIRKEVKDKKESRKGKKRKK